MKNPTGISVVAVLIVSIAMLISTTRAADSAPPKTQEVLNNSSVIELKGLGLGDSVIVDKIKNSQCNFDVSIDGLKQLKGAGVTDTVISAMLSAKTVAGTEPAGDPDDPKSTHEPGIWLLVEQAEKPKMIKLEPSVYAQARTGSGMFAGFGASTKSRAVLGGANSETTITNHHPTFYFYFEKTQWGLSDTQVGATSPNEFILAQFEVNQKDNQRSLVMGEWNAYSGGKSGAENKAVRSIGFEKLAPGIYKVIPKQDLLAGEYGFFYAGTSTMGAAGANARGGKVFDFSVPGDPETAKPVAADEATTPKAKTNFFKKIFGRSPSTDSPKTQPAESPKAAASGS